MNINQTRWRILAPFIWTVALVMCVDAQDPLQMIEQSTLPGDDGFSMGEDIER